MIHDDITMKEKKEILENDRKVRATYHALAAAAADETAGGRFAQSANRQTVVGVSPISYPTQPEWSPWRCDPVPPEMPLGYSVEAQEPVGEPHEILRSLSSSEMAAHQSDGVAVDRPTPVPIAGGGPVAFKR